MKLSTTAILKRWIAEIRKDGKGDQYAYSKRKEHIDFLMGLYKQNDITQFEAERTKSAVLDALITKEGFKGNGKYKQWKENVINDFDDAIQLTYVTVELDKPEAVQSMKKSWNYTVMPDIMAWLKYKYGPNVKQAIIDAAHTPGHEIRYKFYEEVFGVK